MIIKKVLIEEPIEQEINKQLNSKNPSPRIALKAKKNTKLQQCEITNLQQIFQGESSNFNDSDSFNIQYQTFNQAKASHLMNKTYVRQIRNKKREFQHNSERQIQNPQGQKERYPTNFLQLIKKDSFPMSQPNKYLLPDNNYSSESRQHTRIPISPFKKSSLISTKIASQRRFDAKNISEAQNQSYFKIVKDLTKLEIKLSKQNKSVCEINPYTKKQYFHERVTLSSNGKRPKKINSVDYSIIKPNEIKSLLLSNRNDDRSYSKKKTVVDKKSHCELIASIKRKEEILKKQLLIQAQRQRIRREQKQIDIRFKIHTSYLSRRKGVDEQQTNQVQPWQVQGSNLADFI